jgi:hypothetical protein
VYYNQVRDDYLTLGGMYLSGRLPIKVEGADRPFEVKRNDQTKDPDPYRQRDPIKGFLDIPKPVVEALNAVGIVWGAVGFGPQSGDMMHFEDNNGDLWKQIKEVASGDLPCAE